MTQIGNYTHTHNLVLTEENQLQLCSLSDNSVVFNVSLQEINKVRAFSPVLIMKISGRKYCLPLAENPKQNQSVFRRSRTAYLSGLTAMYKPAIEKWISPSLVVVA